MGDERVREREGERACACKASVNVCEIERTLALMKLREFVKNVLTFFRKETQ